MVNLQSFQKIIKVAFKRQNIQIASNQILKENYQTDKPKLTKGVKKA